SMNQETPFFLYLSYTAPHWPLHAKPNDIAKYERKYLKGWDYFRTARHEEMKGLGLVDSKWDISPRDSDVGDWKDSKNKDWEDSKMAVYAAQIDSMDQGIGKVIDTLKTNNQLEDTLIFFMSDNGGCAELMREDGDWSYTSQWETNTINGEKVRVGNIPSLKPGPGTTFMSYETPWTNVSNSPFRLFKRWIHEGGISAPLIAHWPSKIKDPKIESQPVHIMDIPATCIDAAEAQYPTEFDGNIIKPLEGESFLKLLKTSQWKREKPMYWEHEGNQGIRKGEWKLVREYGKEWELYNIIEDRTELKDLSSKKKDLVKEMSKEWESWAQMSNVLPWPVDPNVVAKRLKGNHSHIHQHRGPTASDLKMGKGKFL
ncbi:MAG TPA: sulfatase-like hydrolase/transferase, partial [Dehalococcoidia bacterium]|nr:sulfatase-like hydrolase/transferase [Dehalococcoidia bacterium]